MPIHDPISSAWKGGSGWTRRFKDGHIESDTGTPDEIMRGKRRGRSFAVNGFARAGYDLDDESSVSPSPMPTKEPK